MNSGTDVTTASGTLNTSTPTATAATTWSNANISGPPTAAAITAIIIAITGVVVTVVVTVAAVRTLSCVTGGGAADVANDCHAWNTAGGYVRVTAMALIGRRFGEPVRTAPSRMP